MSRVRRRRGASYLVVAALVAATGYEIALAAGAVSIGNDPGDNATGEPFALTVAIVAMALGVGLALAAAVRPDPNPDVTLVTPAAAFFTLARLYTYDPYYAPALRRMSDGGLVNPAWAFFLVAAALVVAVVGRLRPRLGVAAAGPVVLLCALTTFVEGAGH